MVCETLGGFKLTPCWASCLVFFIFVFVFLWEGYFVWDGFCWSFLTPWAFAFLFKYSAVLLSALFFSCSGVGHCWHRLCSVYGCVQAAQSAQWRDQGRAQHSPRQRRCPPAWVCLQNGMMCCCTQIFLISQISALLQLHCSWVPTRGLFSLSFYGHTIVSSIYNWIENWVCEGKYSWMKS